MFIDTHAHLFYPDYDTDIAEVLHKAHVAGVERCIVPGTNLESSRQAVALAERFDAHPERFVAARPVSRADHRPIPLNGG